MVSSEKISKAQTASELASFDDFQMCNPLVKPTPLVVAERKRRNLPPCEQYNQEINEGKRPDPTTKNLQWLMLLMILATPAGA